MSKAYVDTTVLTNILLKNGELADSAESALKRYDSSELPVYAIKEFKAGPLRNFIWFHNKLAGDNSFQIALKALHGMSMSPKRYATATAIEALEMAASSLAHKTAGDLAKKYGEDAEFDKVLSDEFRLAIKTRIFIAWKKRRKVTTNMVDPLPCYREIAPCEERGLIVPGRFVCEKNIDCSMSDCLKTRLDDLRKLKSAVDLQADKLENRRRAKALRGIYRKPKSPIKEDVCRNLGDAIFALFAPNDSVILTTNLRDHAPLAKALGKKAESP